MALLLLYLEFCILFNLHVIAFHLRSHDDEAERGGSAVLET